MGGFGGLFGGGKQSTTTRGTSSQEIVLPDYLSEIYPTLSTRANELSLRPYSEYSGQTIADFTPDQLAAFQGVRGMQGRYSPLRDLSANLITTSSKDITSDDIQGYMSPYMQNVVDVEKRKALTDFDLLLNEVRDQAASSGAFGGDRQAVLEGQVFNDIATRLSDIQTKGLQSAYTDASALALNQQQNRQRSGSLLSDLAGASQQQDLADLAALEQIGVTQQGQNQQGLSWDYNKWLSEQQYPYGQVEWLANILNPMVNLTRGSYGTETQTSTQKSSSSPLSTALGIASMVAAPFTGGASLMGAAGGAMGGGSLLGSLVGNLGGALKMSTPWNTFAGGSTGNIMWNSPRFMKEGGLVKKYAQGGKVSKSYGPAEDVYNYLTDLLMKMDNSGMKLYDTDTRGQRAYKNLSNTVSPLMQLPLRVLHGAMAVPYEGSRAIKNYLSEQPYLPPEIVPSGNTKEEMQAIYDIQQGLIKKASGGRYGKELTEEEIQNVSANSRLIDEDPALRDVVSSVNKMFMDTKNKVLGTPTEPQGVTPQDSQTEEPQLTPEDFLQRLMGVQGQPQETQLQETPPQEQSTFDLPLWMFGSRLLASPGESFTEALGNAGMVLAEGRLGEKKRQDDLAAQAFERTLDEQRLAAYQMQNEISMANAKMNQLKFGPELEKILAETERVKAQTAQELDPVSKSEREFFEASLKDFPNPSPKKIQELRSQARLKAEALHGGGGGTQPINNNPLGISR